MPINNDYTECSTHMLAAASAASQIDDMIRRIASPGKAYSTDRADAQLLATAASYHAAACAEIAKRVPDPGDAPVARRNAEYAAKRAGEAKFNAHLIAGTPVYE